MSLKKRIALKYIRTKFKLLSSLSKRKAAEQAFVLFCTPLTRNRNELPVVFKEAKKLEFNFHGNTIRGYQWNHPAKQKVLILHGFESSVINFERYIKPLIKKGYEVLAFDALAHGRSGGKTINVLLYKEFIERIYKEYGPVKAFIAHSLGGLALSLALEAILHDATYKAVLIAPATETTTAIDFYFHYLKLDNELRKEFDAVIKDKSSHPPQWFSIRRAAKHIKAQVLWLHDVNDNITPFEDAQKVQALNLPNFRFIITKGLGHRRIYRDNAVADSVLEFL